MEAVVDGMSCNIQRRSLWVCMIDGIPHSLDAQVCVSPEEGSSEPIEVDGGVIIGNERIFIDATGSIHELRRTQASTLEIGTWELHQAAVHAPSPAEKGRNFGAVGLSSEWS
jgi:hypothetical protein